MGALPRTPKRQPANDWHEHPWEPEPLELPVEDPRLRRDHPRDEDDRGTSDDLPGSHVVVIDLA